jgi:hypothetical protein
MGIKRRMLTAAVVTALTMTTLLAPAAGATAVAGGSHHGGDEPAASLLASGLQGASGSTIGPDGALYVTQGVIGQVTRIDPRTGAKSALVTGLPPAILPLGGAIDVAFIGRTAYVLVTLVGNGVPGNTTDDVAGIYRVDDSDSFTVIADLGTWTVENPPPPDLDYFVPAGLQFAMQETRGGFLVTDGHMNRLLKVKLSGEISLVAQYGNIVPTGLDVRGSKVYLAEAGPLPHLPADGKVVSFGLRNPQPRDVAAGGSLLVDVEWGKCGLYALSQGDSPGDDVEPGSPALPDSGELLKANRNGTFSVVAEGLDLPTSVDFSRDTAFVVTLDGEVWKIDVSKGKHHRGCGGGR